MSCAKCGGELIRSFVGATEVFLHRYAPLTAHYPRLGPSRSPEQTATPSPVVSVPGSRNVQLPPDFWSFVDQSAGPEACWPWTGRRDTDGYGQLARNSRAHRLVVASTLGRALTPGEQALHSCDNPPCCNPAHLRVGTNRENILDKIARGRAGEQNRPRTHCKRGHDLTDDNVIVSTKGRRCRTCEREQRKRLWATPEFRARMAAYSRERYRRLRDRPVQPDDSRSEGTPAS